MNDPLYNNKLQLAVCGGNSFEGMAQAMIHKFGITGSVSYWVKAVLVVQAMAALWIGLPGQMSTDSIIQLYEGHCPHCNWVSRRLTL